MADDNKKSWLKAWSFNSDRKLDVDGFGLKISNQDDAGKQEDRVTSPVGSPDASKRYIPFGAPGVGAPYGRSSTDSRSGRDSADGGRPDGSGRGFMDRSMSLDGGSRLPRSRSFVKMDLEHSYSMWSSA